MFGNLSTAEWLWSELAAPGARGGGRPNVSSCTHNVAPAAVDDAFAITAWAVEQAGDLGGRPDRLAVVGELGRDAGCFGGTARP